MFAQGLDSIDELRQWLPTRDTILPWLILLAVAYVLLRVHRFIRSRRPPTIHPRLAPYMANDPSVLAQRKADAAGIVATSSTDRVAGYEIVQQIEAVFEDGHRSPADAIEALKASASKRGANALINLTQQRTAAGRCTAQADAVIIRPLVASKAPATPKASASPKPPIIAPAPSTDPLPDATAGD